MNKFLEKLNEYIFLLLPFSIISGPFLADFSIVIMGIIFIYLSIIRGEHFYYKNYFFILFITWCAYLIIRSLFADNVYLSLQSSLFHFRFGLLLITISLFLGSLHIFYYLLFS